MAAITSTRPKQSERLRQWIDSPIFSPLVTQIVVWVLFWLFVPQFGTLRTVSGVLGAGSINAVVVIGVTMLMIAGEFDLSVGSIIALGGFVFADILVHGGSPVVAFLAALAVGGGLGAINGGLVVFTGIPSFIVTLGTRSIYRAAVWLYTGGNMIQITDRLPAQEFFNGRLDFINNLLPRTNFRTATLWAVALVIIFQIILTRTSFGNQIFAAGGNRLAAVTQGVNVRKVKILCFVMTGVLCAFAGILTFSQFNTMLVVTGANVEMRVIAAAVIGGALLNGGAGSIVGGLLGIILIDVLRSGMILLGMPSDNFEAIVGVTIVGAAALNDYIRKRWVE